MAAHSATEVRWKRFSVDRPPSEPGVYAIRSGRRWLYIGRAVNIRARVSVKTHPAQITRGLASLPISYWWLPVEPAEQARAESALIREHEPVWNGGTTWDAISSYPQCRALLPAVSKEDLLEVLAAISGA